MSHALNLTGGEDVTSRLLGSGLGHYDPVIPHELFGIVSQRHGVSFREGLDLQKVLRLTVSGLLLRSLSAQ